MKIEDIEKSLPKPIIKLLHSDPSEWALALELSKNYLDLGEWHRLKKELVIVKIWEYVYREFPGNYQNACKKAVPIINQLNPIDYDDKRHKEASP